MIVKCNIFHMDCNGDFYGIVYFYQIVMDINVNVLNNKMNNWNVFLVVCCSIALIIKGYQTYLNKFASRIDCNSYNQVCIYDYINGIFPIKYNCDWIQC